MEIRVLHIPDFTKGNSYQTLLKRALENQRIEVELATPTGKFFPILREIFKQNYKILHLHWTHPFIIAGESKRWKTVIKGSRFILEILILKLLSKKVIWTIHNIHNHEEICIKEEMLFNKILYFLSDAVLLHSPECKKIFCKDYKLSFQTSRIHIIPLGNYLVYPNSISRIEARDKLNLPFDKKIFLHIGMLKRYKGIYELIRAFREVNHPHSLLLIVGQPCDKNIEKDLKHLEDSRITLHLDFIPEDEIQVFINASDIVVFPFKKILTSSSILLAMSFGKPIIAPRMGSIPDYVDEKGAILYSPFDERGLIKAIQKSLELSNQELEEMGKRNLEKAKKFDWEDIGQKLHAIYTKVLKR